jgi:hypothetical protein
MLPSSQVEDPHSEVRAIIEGGFAKLQAWLDARLHKQDELLWKISSAGEFPSSLSIQSGWSAKDDTGLRESGWSAKDSQKEKSPNPPVAVWETKRAKKYTGPIW